MSEVELIKDLSRIYKKKKIIFGIEWITIIRVENIFRGVIGAKVTFDNVHNEGKAGRHRQGMWPYI